MYRRESVSCSQSETSVHVYVCTASQGKLSLTLFDIMHGLVISLATLAHLLAHARSSRTLTCTMDTSCPSHAKSECMLALSPSHTRRCPCSGTLLSRILSCYSRMLPLHAWPPTPAQSGRLSTSLMRTQKYCHVRNTISTCHTLTLVSLSTNSIVEESNLQRTKVKGRRPHTERCGRLVCNVCSLLLSWQLSRPPAPRSLRFSTSGICYFTKEIKSTVD